MPLDSVQLNSFCSEANRVLIAGQCLGQQETENMTLIQSDRRRLIVGLGITGKSCMRHLSRLGLSFSVVDTRDEPAGIADIAREFPDVDIRLGNAAAALIAQADELYISPGIAIEDAMFDQAKANNALISGDIDLFAREAQAPVIAITGSNAKSTVTTLVGEMARAAGLNAGVGGNLGEAALDLLASTRDVYVLELSSFQLERTSELQPRVACLLNMSADHLDRHGDMMTYHQAKQRIYRGAQVVVHNRDDALTTPLQTVNARVISFGLGEPDLGHYGVRLIDGERYICKGLDTLMPVASVPLKGAHNLLNVVAAFAVGDAAEFPHAAMQTAVEQFSGLPHRCEFVAEIAGIQFINDSKATNVGASLAAVRGFAAEGGNMTLIAGGDGKGADFADLLKVLDQYRCRLVLIGAATAQFIQTIEQLELSQLSVQSADDLQHAVELAHKASAAGDWVLLSPACASFDMFDSFEHRGQVFCEAVARLASRSGSEVLQ